MSFQNTIRCMNKQTRVRSVTVNTDAVNTYLNTDTNDFSEKCRQLEGILNNIKHTESELVEENPQVTTSSLDEIVLQQKLVSPRKSLDLASIKTKKIELEKSIKDYKRPEKPSKPNYVRGPNGGENPHSLRSSTREVTTKSLAGAKKIIRAKIASNK